jgi:type VI secretion system protein ImpM
MGKAPCQADFLRLNASRPAAPHLLRWFEEGLAQLLRSRGRLPVGPTCFIYTAPDERGALVGAFAPSVDRVGRAFPLAVFTEVDGAVLADRLRRVPLAFAGFLEAAGALLQDAASLDLAGLSARLAALPLPGEQDFIDAEARREQLLAQSTGATLLECFGGEAPVDAACHAVRSVLAACAAERDQPPARASVVLDCPLVPALGPLPWLELTCGLLRWRGAPPTLLWRPERLLLSLGPPPPSTLVFLADPNAANARLWPLRPSTLEAARQARQALSPGQRAVLQPENPLGALLRGLTT